MNRNRFLWLLALPFIELGVALAVLPMQNIYALTIAMIFTAMAWAVIMEDL